MPNTIENPWIKLTGDLGRDDYPHIRLLQDLCASHDGISLKLELEYKLKAAENAAGSSAMRDINEFMYFDGEQLIGYIGICGFGGAAMPLEITGMAHPEYRRQGVFSRLYALAAAECARRGAAGGLGLCDQGSQAGQAFLRKINAAYQCAEFEMALRDELYSMNDDQLLGVSLRKATNADAAEITRQNRIYFQDEKDSVEQPGDGVPLPEDEEKRGMTIYLAQKDGQTVGKVNLELIEGAGAVYGLGILPEYRGRGYGRALLLLAVQALKRGNARDIRLQVAAKNETALRLYLSCGFRQTSVMEYYILPHSGR
ncbi:MAG: GNAT family N-acetyltransferase [Eubacteriales bacterium]|nr:GNAT family N-acetyltransferase [Eubacteriales bacterium]